MFGSTAAEPEPKNLGRQLGRTRKKAAHYSSLTELHLTGQCLRRLNSNFLFLFSPVNYFLRNGANVYSCIMDMTKAFDLVKHSILFKKFICAGLSVIFIRLLIFIYIHQFANIRWNNSFSSIFSMTNGVRQGAILSGFAYCFYMNDLFFETQEEQERLLDSRNIFWNYRIL